MDYRLINTSIDLILPSSSDATPVAECNMHPELSRQRSYCEPFLDALVVQ